MKERIGKIGFSIREEIKRPNIEIFEKLKKYTTPNLSDAMNRFRTMSSSIRPIHDKCCFIGPAITVNVRPGDNLMVHKAIDIAKPGDVIVITTCDCSSNAVWGELMTRAAVEKGVIGAVIEGGARDIKENAEIGFPIFAKYIVASACDKDGPGEINEPISCGGVVIFPGDIIIGDENGVVVIQQDSVEEVIANAENKVTYEKQRIIDIKKGLIISEDIDNILRKKGIIN